MSNQTARREEELALRRQFDEAQSCALRDPVRAAIAKGALQVIIEGREPVASVEVKRPKHNLAAERQAQIQKFYYVLGFTLEISVPTHKERKISNREFDRREKKSQALFYRPASSDVSYEAFMKAVGQEGHWTVADEDERKQITFEPAEQGYWFWADIQDSCPRIRIPWNNVQHSLLCLEEYVILWHAQRILENTQLDCSTWCWLRTRYQTACGLGALFVVGFDSRVHVRSHMPNRLSYGHDNVGGRLAEVIA